jgi:hypothetical protein
MPQLEQPKHRASTQVPEEPQNKSGKQSLLFVQAWPSATVPGGTHDEEYVSSGLSAT